MGHDKIFRASHWQLDALVITDEVFAQIRDAVLGAPGHCRPEDLDAARASCDLASLLQVFDLDVEDVGGQLYLVESKGFGFDRHDGFEGALMIEVAKWSVPGSWLAWGHDHFDGTAVLSATGRLEAPLETTRLPEWWELTDEIESLVLSAGLPTREATLEVVERQLMQL